MDRDQGNGRQQRKHKKLTKQVPHKYVSRSLPTYGYTVALCTYDKYVIIRIAFDTMLHSLPPTGPIPN